MNKHHVKTGESLWLIEQTDQAGIRKFWAGDFWTDNAMNAVRFTSKHAAAVLACHYAWSSFGHPPREYELVDICEHLFQCGTTDLEQQRDAALELAKELRQLKAHTYASKNADLYRGFDNGCEHAGKRIEAIFAPKEEK